MLVVETLEPVLGEFRDLLHAGLGDIDPAMGTFGLTHEVLRAGTDTYVEICAPIEPDGETAANRFLRRGGPGGYMAVIEIPDAAALRSRIQDLGLAMPMAQSHGGNELTQLHPRDFGTLLEADEIRSGADWHYPALEREPSSDAMQGLVAVDVAVNDPGAIAVRWLDVFDARTVDAPTTTIELAGGGVVRFVSNEAGRDGVVAIDLAAVDRSVAGTSIELGGITVRLVD